ncbi:MAG: flagellar protein FliS [Lachnospiraceae bacterium]|jgi:flagellar protein FliS|nr:flagellar protein FliS [Lachnospiraceae bacterium]MCI9602573.1 flagellar protein FliS [Lachnospiraceae bacterium]
MNAYSKYKEDSIFSMSGAEQLLLLFDETIKRLTRAESSLEDGNYDDFEDCLQRTTRIVRYLIDILDMSYPISFDLRRIYVYLIYDLGMVRAGRERRKDEIGRIRHILSELREAFDGASRKVNDMHIAPQREVRG